MESDPGDDRRSRRHQARLAVRRAELTRPLKRRQRKLERRLSAVIQGGLIRRLVPRFGEIKLIVAGPLLLALSFFILGLAPTWTIVNLGDDQNFLVSALGLTAGTVIPTLPGGVVEDPRTSPEATPCVRFFVAAWPR